MTAPVRIDASAWGDLRFATLARLCGFADAEHALIKCAKIWSWQTEHYTPAAPTYTVELDLVESALGPGGAEHMVRARLAEAGPDGLRIRGSTGRIEWLWKKRQASKKGGDATKGKHEHKIGPDGPAVAMPIAQPQPRPQTGPLSPDLPLSGSLNSPSPAREVVQATGWQRRQDLWKCMLAAHRRLRDLGIEPNAPDFSGQCAGVNEANMLACERSLRDAGYDDAAIDAKMRHVVLVVEAECARDRTLKYIKPALLWDPQRVNRAVDTSLEEARRTAAPRVGPQTARRGAIGSATPRSDHGTESKPAREAL